MDAYQIVGWHGLEPGDGVEGELVLAGSPLGLASSVRFSSGNWMLHSWASARLGTPDPFATQGSFHLGWSHLGADSWQGVEDDCGISNFRGAEAGTANQPSESLAENIHFACHFLSFHVFLPSSSFWQLVSIPLFHPLFCSSVLVLGPTDNIKALQKIWAVTTRHRRQPALGWSWAWGSN